MDGVGGVECSVDWGMAFWGGKRYWYSLEAFGCAVGIYEVSIV